VPRTLLATIAVVAVFGALLGASSAVEPSHAVGATAPVPAPVPVPADSSPTAASTTSWSSTAVDLSVGGRPRSYLLSRPTQLSAMPLPVLVELQGCCVVTPAERERSGFLDVTGPAVVVYPVPVDQSWNAGSCCHDAARDDVDDVGFVTALVDDVLATQPDADATRVYLAGYSNGGKLVFRLACEQPQLFAAVASYGAVNALPCPDPPPMSVLELASTGDQELTIDQGTPTVVNGYTEPTVRQEVDDYVVADQCNPTTAVADQGRLTATTWSHCDGGRIVELALYEGGSHDWPTGDATTPSGAQTMWSFFESVPRPTAITTTTIGPDG
jgi:polyhydroxybutyrate depolymerase